MLAGANVICEKPVALSSYDIGSLLGEQEEAERQVHPLLQMRLHPQMLRMRDKIASAKSVRIEYHVYRGPWYDKSWKGRKEHSGGDVLNIGVHLFDVLCWCLGQGKPVDSTKSAERSDGTIEFGSVEVEWHLSRRAKMTGRTFVVDGEMFDVSEGFEGLHTQAYAQILEGNGPTLESAGMAIQLIEDMKLC